MKGIYCLMSAIVALGLSSCDENARLAKELHGTWAGTPENVTDNTAITATLIETYSFTDAAQTMSKGAYGGDISITGMISCSTQILADSTIIEPVTLTASAVSTINGTWTVIDDDEIAVSLNPQTLVVTMDPEAVSVANNVVTNNDNPSIEKLRPGITATLRDGIKHTLSMRYASIRQLDDIKIKGPLLKFEIGKNDYVFTRQGESK
jgi:hypothetical protein